MALDFVEPLRSSLTRSQSGDSFFILLGKLSISFATTRIFSLSLCADL